MKNGLAADAISAWEKSLRVDGGGPTPDATKKKIRDAQEQQLRVRGGAPKAEQK
jgi:hypothetical protein